jgi:hypothetical protein
MTPQVTRNAVPSSDTVARTDIRAAIYTRLHMIILLPTNSHGLHERSAKVNFQVKSL